jgi:hypothetical protein
MAPGVNIYSTAMGGSYGYITGTSASSPHAAGVAALLITSGLTNNVTLRHRLRDSAIDLGAAGWDWQYGNGLINIVQALNFTEPPDQSAPTTTIALSGTMGENNWYVSNVTATVTASDSGGSGVAGTEYSLDAGATWNPYTAPLVFSTDGNNYLVLAKSWDVAGNGEGPPDFVSFKIDQTPPVVTETAVPTQTKRVRKGVIFTIDYTGSADDAMSGPNGTTLTLIDEYGFYSTSLTSSYGTVWVEAWCEGWDSDGRTYTFRRWAKDAAGNQAVTDAISVVVK